MTSPKRDFLTISFAVASALTAVASQFMHWTRAPIAPRSSFSLLRTADRLGFVHGKIATILYGTWFLMPLCAALAFCALAYGFRKSAVTLSALTGTIVGGTALILTKSPLTSLVGARIGLVSGVIAVIATAMVVAGGLTNNRRNAAERVGKQGD